MTESKRYKRLLMGWFLALGWLTALWAVDRFKTEPDRLPASKQQIQESNSKAVFNTLEEADLYQ